MRLIKSKVKNIKRINENTYILSFISPFLAKKARPGQFIHLKINSSSFFLRRPFSIHRVIGNTVYVLFRVRGRGTNIISQYRTGDLLDMIAPLGNGFNCTLRALENKRKILVAGGMGVAPLMFLGEHLARLRLARKKAETVILLGARTKEEILCESDFKKLGFKVYIATENGTKGFKGRITELLKNILVTHTHPSGTHIYACGPKEMFLELSKILKGYPQITCQVAFEQFMGCGLGVCLGCVVETKYGYKRVCKDGPVFNLNEVL